MVSWSAALEFLKTPPGTALLTLLLTWLIGSWISAFWTNRQKRKDGDIAAATELYALYGEFLAICKFWNRLDRIRSSDQVEPQRVTLLERTSLMEGRFESLLLRLTCQLNWTAKGLDDLGLLRQTFQFPRLLITDGKPLPWDSSEDPQYLEFKRISSAVGARLAKRSWRERSFVEKSKRRFIYATANSPHERNFAALGNLRHCPSPNKAAAPDGSRRR